MPLSFLSPLFLLGALAVAVPVVLHLLKREAAPSIPFSAVKFLKRAPIEQTRRKRLRELLLLALRVTALILFAVAFARPYFTDGAAAASSSVTIVAVDTSFSMAAPGRFDRARALALRAVDRSPAGDAVGVVAFDDAATVLVEPGGARDLARSAIERLAPTYGGTKYGAALTRAAALIGSRRGRIVVVTDLQRSGWDQSRYGAIVPGIAVDVSEVGPQAPNLAVKGIRPDSGETVVTVANTSAAPVTSRARLSVDGRVVSDVTFTAEALVSTDVRLPVRLPRVGAVSAWVEDRTGFPADDTRFLVLDPPAPSPVLVVGGADADPFYVQRALGVGAADAPKFAVSNRSGADLAAMGAGELDRQAGVILLTTRTIDRRGRDAITTYVTGGGGLLIAAGGDVEASAVSALFGASGGIELQDAAPGVEDLRLVPSDPRHPLFRSLGAFAAQLGRARFRRVSRLEEAGGGKVLARFSGGSAALAEYPMGQGHVLVFASDLSNRWNDLPLQPTFVPFLHEMVRYLASERERVGGYLVADAPRGLPREPGVRLLAESGRRVAVNVDPRESDFVKMTPGEFNKAITRLTEAGISEARHDARNAEAQQNYWRYGLMLMLVALAAEGVLGRRLG